MSFRFDRPSEEQFLHKPAIVEVARLTTDAAKRYFSDRHYRDRDFQLRIKWQMTEAFKVGAYTLDNGDHEVRLSYGAAIEIYRDAFVLPLLCERVLGGSAFDPIYSLLNYGNRREDVLPAGLNASDAKIEIIRLATTWLFLHEQAHLLQRHREVANHHGAAELLSHDGGVDDSSCVSPTLHGPDAALRHAFEFAADYEAISNLLLAESSHMSEARLWCLAVGLLCLFRRFNETASPSVDDEPVGTHPHPALRMRMVMNRIEQMLALPDYAAGWPKGSAHARAVMDHAVYTADVFWHLRYRDLDERSPFLDRVVANLRVPASYQRAIHTAWQVVRPEIVAGHLGFGEPVVLFLRGPGAVGSRVEPVIISAGPPGVEPTGEA